MQPILAWDSRQKMSPVPPFKLPSTSRENGSIGGQKSILLLRAA